MFSNLERTKALLGNSERVGFLREDVLNNNVPLAKCSLKNQEGKEKMKGKAKANKTFVRRMSWISITGLGILLMKTLEG